MKKRKECVLISTLLVYIIILLHFGVFCRETSTDCIIKLDLFNCFFHPCVNDIKDILLNLGSFVPIGVLMGLIGKRHRIGKAVLVGLFVSVVIEFSQLIWRKGVFDVNDLFNNVVGALFGGLLVTLTMDVRRK